MTPTSQLRSWMESHRDDMVQDLKDYAALETPSDDKELLDTGLGWLERWLHERLGAPASRRVVDGGRYGDMAIADYPAERHDGEWVTALCHYDTVWSKGTVDDWPPSIEGDRLTGPGVFDMKAGLVQLVWALKATAALDLPRPHVRLVLNGDEEIGSPVSRPVIEEAVSRGGPVFVFEASAEGAIKTARKGVGIFRVEAQGLEAHAGLDPEVGVSAIDEIARVVVRLHDAADLAAGTSINVGLLTGGTRTNVTAGIAIADVDVRVSSAAEAARVDAVLADLVPRDPRASLTVSGGWNRPVMTRSAGTADLFSRAVEVAGNLGFTLTETSVGGASDGNFAAALGHPVLDGLGAVGAGAHARNEWVSLDGLVERACLAAGLLESVARDATVRGVDDRVGV